MTSKLHKRLLLIFCGLVAVFLVAPTLMMVPMSFSSGNTLQFPPPGLSLRWYEFIFTSPQWLSATSTSLQVAVATSMLATVLGTAAAFGLVRGRFPGQSLAFALMLAPIIVPIVVQAIGIYAVFVRWQISGLAIGLVLAHTVHVLPFVIVNVSASLSTMDRNLEMASSNLGAGPITTFRYVTLPSILPGVLAGAIFAFILSWDEVVMAIFLTTPFLETLPVLIWSQVETQVNPAVAAVGSLLILVSVLLFGIGTLLRNRTTSERK